jgi:hypothetical protein
MVPLTEAVSLRRRGRRFVRPEPTSQIVSGQPQPGSAPLTTESTISGHPRSRRGLLVGRKRPSGGPDLRRQLPVRYSPAMRTAGLIVLVVVALGFDFTNGFHDAANAVAVPPQSKKLARVRNDPRVVFLCETGERWVDLRAVHFTGTASIVVDPSIIQDVNNAFDARYAALRPPRRKLPGSARTQYRNFHVIEIEPDSRVLSWDNARLMR